MSTPDYWFLIAQRAACKGVRLTSAQQLILAITLERIDRAAADQRKLAAFPKMLEALKLLEVDGFTDHTDEALANCAINGQVWDKRLAQQEISRRTALSLAEEAL